MPSLRNTRVLVVEDSWLIAELVAQTLRDEGARVIGPAGSMDEAHSLCAQTAPDLAVVDLDLNGSPSYPLLDHLDERQIPTVVITGNPYAALVPRSLAAIVRKPFAASQLVRALQQRPGH